MRIDKDWVIIGILFCVIAFLSVKIYNMNKQSNICIEQIHKHDDDTGRYSVIFHDQTIASLKKTNKDLYDSLQVYKDKVDYLLKFKYEKEYSTGTVTIDTTKKDTSDVKVFEYGNNNNDTLNYNLKIGSTVEPKWYKLDLKLSNEFTIVNKRDGDLNETTIFPSNNGNISDVTVFKKKNKFWDNFSIGPSVNAGYDIINKQFGVNVGISVTYKLNK